MKTCRANRCPQARSLSRTGLAVLGLVCLLAHASPVAAEHEMDPSGFMQCAYDWAAEQDQLPYSSCSVACDQAGQACVDSAAVSAPVVSSLADGLIDACGSEAGAWGEGLLWCCLASNCLCRSRAGCWPRSCRGRTSDGAVCE